jgi:predicted  nucleic acid-binding Zn-ribbon protein
MQEELKPLLELQEIDIKIQELDKNIALVPGDILELRKKVAEIEKKLAEVEAKLGETEKESRHHERLLQAKENELNKYRSQMYEVKTNKEYSALMIEIDNLRQENSQLEDKILTLLEERDRLLHLIKDEKIKLAADREKLKIKEEENRERIKELEKIRDSNTEKREILSRNIEKQLLESYEKIRKAERGIALAAVEGNVCYGCFTEIPYQTINEIIKGNRLIVCERCSRMLYWKENGVVG